ncbi:ankyrin repeat-containing domain protein [Mycena haematopus]|nr:ankyrin repeat-containing domain protein [Mycena haematopus]
MSDDHRESLTLSLGGGRGGAGGSGYSDGLGGRGGDGHGATVKVEAGTVHLVINKVEEKNIPRQDFLNWISPINFFLRQADIFQTQQKGTGEWLLANPKFQAWKTGSTQTLWCHGIPGAGKTVLAYICSLLIVDIVTDYSGSRSIIVEHLSDECENNKNLGVACIYLNHKETNDQTLSKLLAALWRQLVYGRDVGSIAKNLYAKHKEKGTAPSLEEIIYMLNSIFAEFSKVYLVVDAIDEYPEAQRSILLKHLTKQMGLSLNVNLMVTSRPHVAPSPSLSKLETLEISAMPADIQRFVDMQIDSSPRLFKHIQKQPKLREDIYSKINSESVDGMFLLAKLHIDSLSTKQTISKVRQALNVLPKDIYSSYEVAIERIDTQTKEDRKTAWSTITWVANAKRPLKIEELQVALAVEPGMQQLDEENLMDIDTILSVCAGLVSVDKESSIVRLVHYTTQEYLDSIQSLLFPNAQTEITRTLLTFLTFDGYPDPSWKTENLPPLVEYSQYCLAHATGQPEVQLREILLRFLSQALQWRKVKNQRLSWEYGWNSPPWNYLDVPSQPSVLWFAAAANLVETTKSLLDGVVLLKQSACPEIIVASYYGHTKIVSILLDKGADINATGGIYGSALQAAAAGGHIEIVSILLDKGADINAAGEGYGIALQAAAAGGHTGIVSILLDKGADINATGGIYGSTLQAAAAGSHIEIVSILLDKSADINATGGIYGSTLQAAAAGGHIEIVSILLDKGADINATGGIYGSTLQVAAAGGHIEIVSILLDKGTDINAIGGIYGSTLQTAAAGGHIEIVSILLDKGADINATGGKYGSTLQAAATGGHTEIVSILLDKGADINATGGRYGSTLQAAAAGGHIEIVSILLDKGADINAIGGRYGSTLQAAAARGHIEIISILLNKGADINATGGIYGSTLQAAAVGGHIEIVSILLDKGAYINAAGEEYESALQAAAAGGHIEIVSILLDKGADINAAGEEYGSALQAAAAGGHIKIVNILWERGVRFSDPIKNTEYFRSESNKLFDG